MKKFNLFKEIITVDKPAFMQAINTAKIYGINIKGKIIYEPFKQNEILIYKGKHTPQAKNALLSNKPQSFSEILGKNYQLVEDDDRVLIKAFSNWQALIKVNTPRASYDDTTGDGVDKFSDENLEDIGWQATEFNITYRMLVEILEEKCEGTLLCIEQEEPFLFSGLGFLDDNKHAYDVLFNFCQTRINDTIKNYTDKEKELLNDDEKEAIKFFKCQF
jgi:DNA-binding ferritin-like protein (Dps family)